MSKIPQEALDAGARAIWERIEDEISFEKACKEKHPQIEWTIKDAEVCIEAADAARAQGAETEPGNDIAKQRFELWFFRNILDEHRLKLLALFDVPTDDKIGQTHGFQKRALHHILSALATPPAPQPTEREKVLEEVRLEAKLREHWVSFCDSDPFPSSDVFADEMEAAGFIEMAAVDEEDLESPFAAERGIERGGSIWKLTALGRAVLAGKAPSQTDRAEGGE